MSDSNGILPPQDMSAIADEIEAAYWVPILKTPFAGLDEIVAASQSDCPELHQAIASFSANLHAAKELLEFPYFLLLPYLTDVIDHFGSTPLLPDNIEDIKGNPEQEARAIDLVTLTLKASKEPLMKNKVHLQRLLHQACLLIWSALETYAKQVFIAALNEKPALYTAISKNQELKERLNIANGSWISLLQTHDFDLKGKLGTIVAANRDFSSPRFLLDLFPVMLDGIGTMGFDPLKDHEATLWKLGQRRHLIAHRCGIVDQDYLDKTHDDSQELGKLLNLRGRDLGAAMGSAAGFAVVLYGNARRCWW